MSAATSKRLCTAPRALHTLAPAWLVTAVTAAVTLWLCSPSAVSSRACIAPCYVKCSTGLHLPWDLAFTWDPHPWRSSALPLQAFSFFLVVSDLSPPLGRGWLRALCQPCQAGHSPACCQADLGLGLRKRLAQLMSPAWHPAYSHTTCGLSHPCPCNLEQWGLTHVFSRKQSLQSELIL